MKNTKFRYIWVGHFSAKGHTARARKFAQYLKDNPSKAGVGLGSGMHIDHVQPPAVGWKSPQATGGAVHGVNFSLNYVPDSAINKSKSIFDRSFSFGTVAAARKWLDSEQGQIWSTGADNCALMALACSIDETA